MGVVRQTIMNEHQIRERVRAFLLDATRVESLRDDLDIFKAGLVNSLFALKLVQFVEREFDVLVENDELNLANFSTTAAIAALVARKLGGATAIQQ